MHTTHSSSSASAQSVAECASLPGRSVHASRAALICRALIAGTTSRRGEGGAGAFAAMVAASPALEVEDSNGNRSIGVTTAATLQHTHTRIDWKLLLLEEGNKYYLRKHRKNLTRNNPHEDSVGRFATNE